MEKEKGLKPCIVRRKQHNVLNGKLGKCFDFFDFLMFMFFIFTKCPSHLLADFGFGNQLRKTEIIQRIIMSLNLLRELR